MTKWKKYSLIALLFVVFVFTFLSWYKYRYSMDAVEPFEVSVANAEHQVLIATQGSAYKDAVVGGVISALEGRPISINVIDVSGLSEIDIDTWSAVVVLHTWENWKSQPDAKQFLDGLNPSDLDKVTVLTTSGSGDYKIEGIDAITSASVISDVPRNVRTIVQRVDAVIAK